MVEQDTSNILIQVQVLDGNFFFFYVPCKFFSLLQKKKKKSRGSIILDEVEGRVYIPYF